MANTQISTFNCLLRSNGKIKDSLGYKKIDNFTYLANNTT